MRSHLGLVHDINLQDTQSEAPSQSSAADLQPEEIERLQSTMVTGALLCRQGVLRAANFDSSGDKNDPLNQALKWCTLCDPEQLVVYNNDTQRTLWFRVIVFCGDQGCLGASLLGGSPFNRKDSTSLFGGRGKRNH